MINKETIISVYDEKLTLLQWLKSVNKALDEAVLTNVEIEQRGNATYRFVFTFEDGSIIASNDIIVAQGESVVSATITNGHLLLTLSNNDVLDAGNVKPVSSFSINTSQHLIVHYGDGTTQDLGAIFSGNVNIDGNLTANSIIENMSGYSFVAQTPENLTIEIEYAGAVKTGNKLTLALAGNLTKTGTISTAFIGRFNLPNAVLAKLIPTTIGSIDVLELRSLELFDQNYQTISQNFMVQKYTGYVMMRLQSLANFVDNTKYHFRYEVTFLLSDSMAS